MAKRYRIGLEAGVASDITKRNPGFTPIVDMGTCFGFGVVVAICDNARIAERICALLNAHEEIIAATKIAD